MIAKAGAGLKVAGIVGWPVRHSLSPLIHQTWAAREGVDGVYLPLAVEPGEAAFARAMAALMRVGFSGVNVTLPHKENCLRYAASASKEATSAGAANMLSFRAGGPYAENSDVAGFASALRGALTAGDRGRRAVVLGAGGAARGVVLALKGLGFPDILVLNRTEERAQKLAKDFAVAAADWKTRHSALADAGLIVNATSLGMSGAPALDLRLDRLAAGAIVADIVYGPDGTGLLKEARQRGLRTVDGLSMLMHQAVPGYKSWLGREAVVDADLRRRLEAALQAGKTP